jgi:hypothetical protein
MSDAEQVTEEIRRLTGEYITRVRELTDSVHVFCTFHAGEDETTRSYDEGSGNLYAQIGQVDEWRTIQNEYVKTHARKK